MSVQLTSFACVFFKLGNSCGNINWARRGTCNLCHAARFSKEEARTGLGGGYYEREQVEYKDRNDSDNEYDDVSAAFSSFYADCSNEASAKVIVWIYCSVL